jgi:starch synthase
MKILMATSEAVPYIKTGGLADVAGSLSEVLTERGHELRLVLPYYRDIAAEKPEKLPFELNIGSQTCSVFQCTGIAGTPCYLIAHPVFTQRSGVYGETSHSPYPDNLYRFTLFSKAVLELCSQLKWYPEILHCHDWTTGLLPSLLRRSWDTGFSKTKSIMTIHNLGYQGEFTKHDIHAAGLDADLVFGDEPVTYEQRVNMLKTGISKADIISTVSKTYAREIQTRTMGHGLDLLLSSRSEDVYGILNGVDYSEWNPEHDRYIPHQYGVDQLERKAENKIELQKYCGLEQSAETPLFGMVSRLADQKGFRELCSGTPSALERMLTELPVQIVIVGTGDHEIESYLSRLEEMYENFSAHLVFNNYVAHLVEAGADFFLMPSRYEPCGLNQIYSLRYGTLPVVRKTGGLADTVTHINEQEQSGTGFVFDLMSGEAIFDAVQEASLFYKNEPKAMKNAVIRAMKQNFSWEKSADEYESMYTYLVKKGEHHE